MPEGDSIYNLATRLQRRLLGKRVRAFSAHTVPDADAATLVGQMIVAIESRGKNLLVRFTDGRTLHVHLRMLGRVRFERPRSTLYRPRITPPQLRIAVDGAAIVGERIPVLRLLKVGAVDRAFEIQRLGPDLAAADFDEDEAVRRLRKEGRQLRGHVTPRPLSIGEALLLQRALAGIGNIFKSETLFLEGVDPKVPVSALDDATLLRLVRRARVLLRANLNGGPRITRPSLGGPRLWVYARAGRPCFRCKTPIITYRQGAEMGRSTFACPACQDARVRKP